MIVSSNIALSNLADKLKLQFILFLVFSVSITTLSAKIRIVGIDPVYKVITIKNYYTDTQNLAKMTIVYKNTVISLANLTLVSGSLLCPPKNFAFFSGLNIDYDSGSVGMYDNRYSPQIIPSNFADFVQWGRAGQQNEDLADSMKFWVKGEFLNTVPPYNYNGGSLDRGKQFWQSYKMPSLALKFVYINPYKQQIGIKNTGGSNVDIANLYIANDTGSSDSISHAPFQVLKGKLNILKNDTIILSGLYIGDTVGSVALFFNINRYDTVNLIDYVKWGRGHSRFAYLAQQKNIWDTLKFLTIKPNDSFRYTGNFTKLQTGANYWQVYKDTTTIDTTAINNYPLANDKISIERYNGILKISNHTNTQLSLQLYDQQGRLVMQSQLLCGSNEYHTSEFKDGIYYIIVQKDGWHFLEKIIVAN